MDISGSSVGGFRNAEKLMIANLFTLGYAANGGNPDKLGDAELNDIVGSCQCDYDFTSQRSVTNGVAPSASRLVNSIGRLRAFRLWL